MSREFCPFYDRQPSIEGIVRWTDLMDSRLKGMETKYDISFSKDNIKVNLEEEQFKIELEQGKYCCWGDGSGFEYDIMSRNVIGQGCPVEWVYDISSYGVDHEVLKFSTWNAWIDKFQYDYRYGRVSDTNAECVLFPNVDNPWMFTEYVFQGVGGNKNVCALDLPSEYVV
jgi:hypothetical protein